MMPNKWALFCRIILCRQGRNKEEFYEIISCFFILVIILVLALIAFLIWFMKHRENIIIETGYITLSWVLTFIIVFFIVLSFVSYRSEQKLETALSYINDGWEIYLDGRQVEIEHINIEEYSITFNEEAEKIILSH